MKYHPDETFETLSSSHYAFFGPQPSGCISRVTAFPARMLTRHKQTASNIHSITEVGSTSGDHTVQPPAHSRITRSRLFRPLPSWVLSIFKDANSTFSLGTIWQMLQSLNHLHDPFLHLTPACPCFLVVGSPELVTVLLLKFHQCWVKWSIITSFDLLAMLLLMQLRILLALFSNIHVYRYNRILRTWLVLYFQGLLYVKQIQTTLFC